MAETPPIRPIRIIGQVKPNGEVQITPRFMRWLEDQQQAISIFGSGEIVSVTAAIGTRYAATSGQVEAGSITSPAGTGYTTDDVARAATTYAEETAAPAGTDYS